MKRLWEDSVLDVFKSCLRRRFPLLHRWISFIKWETRYLGVRLLGTKTEERLWAHRSLQEIQRARQQRPEYHPHRDLLLKRLEALSPFSSILEVGCGFGQNLYRIARRFPEVRVTGIDINPNAISEARRWFSDEGIGNANFFIGQADQLDWLPSRAFDIVLTDALLMYIGPDKILNVIEQLIRIASRWLILVEWHCEPQLRDPNGLGVWHFGHWKRNYVNLLSHFSCLRDIRLTKIPRELWSDENWSALGWIIEAKVYRE